MAAQIVHKLLYLLLVAQSGLEGLLLVAETDQLSLFERFISPRQYHFPQMVERLSLRGLVACFITGVAGLHRCPALMHHFALTDDTFLGMPPWLVQGKRERHDIEPMIRLWLGRGGRFDDWGGEGSVWFPRTLNEPTIIEP